MENKPELTFIIPTIYNFQGLSRCVDTIKKYHEPDTYRIFVIDNSGKGLASQVLKENKVHLIIESYRNLGFSKSINTGVKLVETPYICIINDDVEIVHKDWWPNIKDVFTRKNCEKVLAVAPSSIKGFPKSPEMDLLPYKEEYTDTDWQFLMSENNPMAKILGFGKKFNPSWIFDGTMFFCVCFKKEIFDIVGMLDEGFWPGTSEDYDMCRRICLKGYRIVQTCNSFVYHHWRTTCGKYIPSKEMIKKYRRWDNFDIKWNNPNEKTADIYGNGGIKDVPTMFVPI